MTLPFEQRYADVLQNIEFAIVETNRRIPDLLDYHVDAALEVLAAAYSAEHTGRTQRPVHLEGPRLQVYEAIRSMCEWRLGRAELAIGNTTWPAPTRPVAAGEIAMCLKRIRKSVQRWNKQAGRQGYLQFISASVG